MTAPKPPILFIDDGPRYIVRDGFESGDFSSPGYPNFKWAGDPNSTGMIANGAARQGSYAMSYNYTAGSHWREKRFEILKDGVTDFWISWWLRIPDNFFHSGEVYSSNNKLLRVWQVDYQNPFNEKGGMEFRAADSQWDQVTGHSYFYLNPGSGSGFSRSPTFARVPEDQGKWQHFIYNIRCETSPGARDGVRRCWRKWEDESKHTLVSDWQNQNVVDAGGFKYGYLLGYANAAYDEDTEFLIDDVVISSTPLI